VKRGKLAIVPAPAATHGHGTYEWPALWKEHLAELLDASGSGR
jgi:hypothetical protein